MENPNYVLRFDEYRLMATEVSKPRSILKKVVLTIITIIIVGSFIFGENLFAELSWTARISLILIGCSVFFPKFNTSRVPSPIELRFYDDYLILYREKRYYNKKVTRKELNKFYYKDIHKIEYRKSLNKFYIFGIVEGTWYNYKKDGSLPNEPSYHKTTDSLHYFYVTETTYADIITDIERNTPIKVTISKNEDIS